VVERGIVAAGHPLTAAAGAEVLRAGGNAVDAAIAAMLTSFVAEPLLTGLGAGGYLLVAPPSGEPVLLDFFVAAPGLGADLPERAALLPVEVSFGDALQVFWVGAASCAVFGTPAGVVAAVERFGTVPLADLAAPAAALARRGVHVNRQQAYLFSVLGGIVASTPEARARFFVDDRPAREGDLWRDPDLADALDRLGADGAEPFYRGDIGAAISAWVGARGGMLTPADLDAYRVVRRTPARVAYRGREVHTNPPPSAGGQLLADSLEALAAAGEHPDEAALVRAMTTAPRTRSGVAAGRLGSTTHISVLDADGWACAVTCTNGEGSGVVVPGTGVHVNNMMGEQDLSPDGFFGHHPGQRLPSLMAPTILLRNGVAELVLGSAGSSRICSALLQVIVNVIDRNMTTQEAVDAPRLHAQDGRVYVEPGVDVAGLTAAGHSIVPFRARNLFFGGCQAIHRRHGVGALSGGGDPRRGGEVAFG
jgi:gamma-glutamyltranspeptidase/glutathione hydrolase